MAISPTTKPARGPAADASYPQIGRTPLAELDEELCRGIPAKDRPAADQRLVVQTAVLTPGGWDPPAEPPANASTGLLIASGLLIRKLRVDGSRAIELLGKGDLVRPWQEDSASFTTSSWRVIEPCRAAILDDRLIASLAQWPMVTTALLARALKRSRWLIAQAGIAAIVGVEDKLLNLLWHIGERWGRAVPDVGIVIDLPLTHELLAEMVGVSRSYATHGIGRLIDNGRVSRPDGRAYVLHGDPPALS
jgi:CRP/FNR family transcriptional regulator, cyclic AMP receptor protein